MTDSVMTLKQFRKTVMNRNNTAIDHKSIGNFCKWEQYSQFFTE